MTPCEKILETAIKENAGMCFTVCNIHIEPSTYMARILLPTRYLLLEFTTSEAAVYTKGIFYFARQATTGGREAVILYPVRQPSDVRQLFLGNSMPTRSFGGSY